QAGESRIIEIDDLPSAREEAIELCELRHAKRGLDVRHAIVEAQNLLLAEPRLDAPILSRVGADKSIGLTLDSVAAQKSKPMRQFGVVGDDRPTLPGGDLLDRMKGEDRHV